MSRFAVRLFVAASIVLFGAIAIAQEAEKHVFVTVLDKEGLPIEGLTAEHFAIREAGRDRAIVRVEPLRVPMHVAVLIDTSALGGTPDDSFRSAVTEFVLRLAALNQVAVYAFGDRATPVTEFTQDQARLRSALSTMFSWVHTRSALMDGIDRALLDLEKIETARPVIIAISGETAEASSRSAGSVIKKMISQSTSFHVVSLTQGAVAAARVSRSGTDPSGMNIAASSQAIQAMRAAGEGDRERNQAFQQGTTATGGSRQRITNTMALGPALHRLGNELANSYRVTFSRPGTDKIRDLQVGIMLEGVTVRATAAPFGTR
jgi:VWFA-related protein